MINSFLAGLSWNSLFSYSLTSASRFPAILPSSIQFVGPSPNANVETLNVRIDINSSIFILHRSGKFVMSVCRIF